MPQKKLDSTRSLIIAGICAALILFVELFWRSEFVHASTGLHILNYVLIGGYVASAVWMFVNDIDAGPRMLTMIIAIAIAILVGIFGSQYKEDKKAGITQTFYNDFHIPNSDSASRYL